MRSHLEQESTAYILGLYFFFFPLKALAYQEHIKKMHPLVQFLYCYQRPSETSQHMLLATSANWCLSLDERNHDLSESGAP